MISPSTSQGMHKRESRQWKTYCWQYHSVVITAIETRSFHFIKSQKVQKSRENGSGP